MYNKKLFFATLFMMFMSNLFAQTQPQDAVVGIWFNAEKDGKVQIYKQNDKYYGKLIWMKNPRKDTENPDVKLKSKDLQGVILLKDFVFKGKAWEDGTIYDPKNGKTYSCIIKQKGPNGLDIRGFVGISLLGRTTTWTKAPNS
jgi:uncharacterized protein (DUF2147 family)